MRQEKPPAPSSTRTFKLDDYTEDWTRSAASGIFRRVGFWQKERTRFAVTINRRDRPKILLLGNYETASLLVQQFACDLTQIETASPLLEGETQVRAVRYRLLRLDWTEFQLDASVMQFLKTVREMRTKPLLFVGTVDDIIYWSDAMLAAVQQGTVSVIAIATPTQWEKFQSHYPAAASTFTVITVDEPDEGQVLEWLKAHKTVYADSHFVTVDDDALTTIVELARERFPNQPLLAMARNLLDEVCTYAWIKATKPPEEVRNLLEEIERLEEEARRALAASNQRRTAELHSKKQDLKSQFDEMMSEWYKQIWLTKPQVTVETI